MEESIHQLQADVRRLQSQVEALAAHLAYCRYLLSPQIAADRRVAVNHAAIRTRHHQPVPDPAYQYAPDTVFGYREAPPEPLGAATEHVVGIRHPNQARL